MKKSLPVILLVVGLVLAAALWYFMGKDETETTTPASCADNKPGKFPAWDDTKVPHGDLNKIAKAYLTPAIGGTDQANGSIVGGFFKAIDVYPSLYAAKYYKNQMIAWANSPEGLPYWQTIQGEYVCLN